MTAPVADTNPTPNDVDPPPGAPSPTLAAIVELLTWADPCAARQLTRRLAERYLEVLSAALGATLAAQLQVRPTQAQRLINALQSLPGEQLVRVLTAPETWSRLSRRAARGAEETLAFLTNAVVAEARRQAGATAEPAEDEPGVRWTALGEPVLPATAGLPPPDGPAGTAPLRPVADALVVDGWSPFARGPLPGMTGEPADFEAAELADVLRRLESAASGIAAVSPAAYDLLRTFGRVLVLRKEAGHDAGYGSSSTSEFIGRLALFNPQRMSTARLAEALVHESIHSLLYVVELNHPFVLDADAAVDVLVTSPWTGARLQLHSYLHACLVWYGLWHFWRQATGQAVFPAAEVRARRAIAAAGFGRAQLIDDLLDRPTQEVVAPALCSVLRDIQHRVRTAKGFSSGHGQDHEADAIRMAELAGVQD